MQTYHHQDEDVEMTDAERQEDEEDEVADALVDEEEESSDPEEGEEQVETRRSEFWAHLRKM